MNAATIGFASILSLLLPATSHASFAAMPANAGAALIATQLVSDNGDEIVPSLTVRGDAQLEKPADELRILNVSRELLRRDILIDFRPGAGIRLSPHFYNSDEEIPAVSRPACRPTSRGSGVRGDFRTLCTASGLASILATCGGSPAAVRSADNIRNTASDSAR